jgi:hypothetical protein
MTLEERLAAVEALLEDLTSDPSTKHGLQVTKMRRESAEGHKDEDYRHVVKANYT